MASDPFPAIVQPMLPTLVKLPFSNPEWLFEPKWDGYRAICFIEKGSVRFVSKNRKSLTQRFPDLQRITKSIKGETAILDGEIVALDKKGLPCFAGLRSGKVAKECAIVFYAFDLLYMNGNDLTQKPVAERKRLLKRILPKNETGRVRYTEHIIGDGEGLFRELEKRQLEGMIAKRADSLYVGGRTRVWLKVKTKAGREEMRIRSETWGYPTA
jgi:bifunctional non-homologous end joining protein LigD